MLGLQPEMFQNVSVFFLQKNLNNQITLYIFLTLFNLEHVNFLYDTHQIMSKITCSMLSKI